MAKQYGNKSFKWAIAGRRRSALEKVRKELRQETGDASFNNLPIVLADSDVPASLLEMAKQSKVIITTTGPFSKYGSPLVHACAVAGTHYCDITGETDWVREMIDKYDDIAQKTGARIVSFCGHDCVPWDLSTLLCAEHLRTTAAGEQLKSVRFYDEIRAQASGGTLATVLHVLGNRVVYKSKLGFDPLLKSSPAVSQSTNKVKVKNTSFLTYSKEMKSWVGPFVMAAVMSNCIRRSNAVLGYSESMVYAESEVYPSFFAGFINMVNLILGGTMLLCTPLRLLAVKTIIPSPGQGPSATTMDAGFLKVTAHATGTRGSKVQSTIYFPTDPGYRDTARMLVESGLVLALDGQKVKVGGGCWTPAACQGTLLLDRLVATGTKFHIKSL